jgi:hypothetical protein
MVANMEITKAHWLRNKTANEELIINNFIQIEMAKTIIKLCNEKIKEFPEETEVSADKTEI